MSNVSSQRKVRVACQRCRARRVRCDGGIPSCANCAKAGTPCVDIDARNAENLIPRNTLAQAKARIQWLEDVITTRLPEFDISAGPQVEFDGADLLAQTEATNTTRSADAQNQFSPRGPGSNKRSHASIGEDDTQQSFNSEARSVALDLGRLSLNADSREKHYLGSSSGLIFSYLIGTPPSTADESPQTDSRKTLSHTPQMRRTFETYHRLLVASLPLKHDALSLLHIYVQHIHPDHPILHLQSIVQALDSLYHCRDTAEDVEVEQNDWPTSMSAFAYNGDIDMIDSQQAAPINLPTAIFHCFMVLTLAATVKIGGTQNEFAPAPFYRVARAVALDALSNTSITSLQGISLLAAHALMAPAKLNIWTLSYICTAHCIDLGIHRQQAHVTSTARITRSLVFHSIYSLDRMIATIQGRPLGIRDETFDVDLPTLQDVQSEIESQGLPPLLETLAKESAQYTLHRFKLDKIVSEIKTIFYFLPDRVNPSIWSTDYGHQQQRVRKELDDWYATASPAHDNLKERWHLNIEQQYQAAVVLLYQPSQVLRQPSDAHLLQCFDAASRQIHCYNSLYDDIDMLHFDFRTVRSILACGATIVYCFWTSKSLSVSPQASQLPRTLRLCTTLLAVGAIWWPSLRKGRSSFQKLVDLTLQRLSNVQRDVEHQRRKRPNRGRSPSDLDASVNRNPTRAESSLNQHHATFLDNDPMYMEHVMPSILSQQQGSNGQSSDQWQTVDPINYNVTNDHNSLPSFGLEDPLTYDMTNVPTHIEPEIAAFLNDYFLDDTSWNLAEAGPPLTFHFGNL